MKITHCKLKKEVQKEPLRSFVPEVTARSAADILGIHPDSAALFYRKIRTVTNHRLALAADEVFEGPAGPGASCFGVRRKGGRGRGAAGKAVVFGIPKRNGRAYTVAADDAEPETLPPAVKKKIMPDGIVYADSPGSRGKSDAGGFTRCRTNRSEEFADRRNHINGIGNFWNQAKRALRKYNGIDRKPFPPLLRECEFRLNFGTPSRQLKILRDRCGI
ncbi:IS1595 family transposase [Neisseria gonorrhoeae]